MAYSNGIYTTAYSHEKLFIFDNRFDTAVYTAGGSPVTIPKGTVMGRIAATSKIVPMTSAATNGSQYPIGILAATYTVAANASQTMTFCVSGEVDEALIDLQGSDTLATVVELKTIRDRIGSDSLGIDLKVVDELSKP